MSATTPEQAAKATKGQACRCGCGDVTRGGVWLPGHDSTHKAALLRRFDGGAWSAGEELVRRGWYDEGQLHARLTKRLTAAA